MKVCAIVCEYNPLHLGHAFQMEKARALCGADYVLCLMSGPFVQRGEPACVDKWTRARAALLAGADLVLELPALFSLRAGHDFAFGAVALLDSLSAVTHLSFGSELDDLEYLRGLTAQETDQQSVLMKAALTQGHSWPKARALALGMDLPANATLGVEYLRALERLNSPIEPVVVKRTTLGKDLPASSSELRLSLRSGDWSVLEAACPVDPAALTRAALEIQSGPAELSALGEIALYRLRGLDAAELAAYPGMDEGLEHRFLAAARRCTDLNELLAAVKTRRYTLARLKRSLLHVLLGSDHAFLQAHLRPEYARVLGFRRTAEPLLRELGRCSRVPLLLRPAELRDDPLYRLDLRAQDLWGLCQKDPKWRQADRDLDEPLIKL